MPQRHLSLILSLVLASVAAAQTEPATSTIFEPTIATTGPASASVDAKLELATQRLVVFKDGHGLVIQSGKGTADQEGHAYITDVPDSAVLGCFWAVSDDDKILAMRAEWIENRELRQKNTTALTMGELLRANVGKQVVLKLNDNQMACEGKIVELLDLPPDTDAPQPPPAAPSPYPEGFYSSRLIRPVGSPSSIAEALPIGGQVIRDLARRGGEYVVLDEGNGKKAVLQVGHVEAIRSGGDVVTVTAHQQEVLTRTKRLSFDFGKDAAGKKVSLRLFYFTAGLRWIPTYRVSGELKDKADLALQGEILNEVTDVEHAALDLVVGVPHFRFADTPSPLTLEQTLRAAMSAANVSVGNNGQQMLNSQFAMDNRARVMPAEQPQPGMAAAPELLGATGEQDLFVYGLKDFSLKKGARATVPLWQQQANLRHVYTYTIAGRRSQTGGSLVDDAATPSPDRAPGNPASPNRIVMNQVWHQLELTNGGDVPWTTGAALMLRGTLPLGQDLLVYTPPTGKALLPVTVAVDLRGTVDEQETERTPNALRFDGYDFARITKRGTITLNSYRKEKSLVRVSLAIGGKIASASDNGQIKLNDFRPDDWADNSWRVNNHSDVTWEMTIDPGATKTITYEVSFYTR